MGAYARCNSHTLCPLLSSLTNISLRCAVCSPESMTNWRDLAHEVSEACSFSMASEECSNLAPCDSLSNQASTFHGWLVHVSRHILFPNF